MKDKLSGKKTYFTAAAAALTAFGAYFKGVTSEAAKAAGADAPAEKPAE